MASLSTVSTQPPQSNLIYQSTKPKFSNFQFRSSLSVPQTTYPLLKFSSKSVSWNVESNRRGPRLGKPFAVAETEEAAPAPAPASEVDPSSEAARKLYVGNIPRTVNNEELTKIFEEHGAVEKTEVMYDKYSGRSRRFAFVTMKTAEDVTAAIEKLNGTEIGGREIKVNVTEKPLQSVDLSLLQADDSKFVDSPHKVYVGNLANSVTAETLEKFFSEKGNVLGAKISRVPGTSKSSGFGFVAFSSQEDVEAAIASLNDSVLEGQKIRVNKA